MAWSRAKTPGAQTLGNILPLRSLKSIEYGVYGDLIIIYPKPYSIDLRGTITPGPTSETLYPGGPSLGLILDVGGVDGNTAGTLLRRVVDLLLRV